MEKKAKSSLGSWLCRRRTMSEEMGLFQRLRDRDRHLAPALFSPPSVLVTAGETEAPRGRAVPGVTWQRQASDQHGYAR